MDQSRGSLRLVLSLLAGAVLASIGMAEPPQRDTAARPLYDADANHLWNRLHEALFARVGPDGRVYGRDRLEPLLWLGTKHLLDEQSNRRAVALLEEFLRNHGEKQLDDPLRRALLQRDLWLVFNWLIARHDHFEKPELDPAMVRAAQDRMIRPLAAVIGRLALTPEQIAGLPDNYAAAVAAGAYPKRFDPEHPEQPYLPPDLFAADGPWVCLGRPDGPIAPTHLRDDGTNMFTNSAFLLFVRLPAGRSATLDYVKRLRSFDGPLLVAPNDPRRRDMSLSPNPNLPPLPAGTEMALVRRALLISTEHKPVASALTESVQLRVYRQSPAISAESLDAALGNGTAANLRAQKWQAFHEFQLSRAALLARRAGGLRAIETDERDFPSPFNLAYHDVFEDSASDLRRGPFAESARTRIKTECFACHGLPGVASFNSYYNFRHHLNDRDATARPFALEPTTASRSAAAAVKWKESRPDWIALRKLLEK